MGGAAADADQRFFRDARWPASEAELSAGARVRTFVYLTNTGQRSGGDASLSGSSIHLAVHFPVGFIYLTHHV
ncbi:hypothetical protein GCM10020219_042800 [Nonomuraea dietziae]